MGDLAKLSVFGFSFVFNGVWEEKGERRVWIGPGYKQWLFVDCAKFGVPLFYFNKVGAQPTVIKFQGSLL